MGTNSKAWPTELKERCEAVGWEVTLTRQGHYKVLTPAGYMVFPSTPSDKRSKLNAMSQAKRFGLHLAEKRVKLIKERDRLKRIDDDRAKADALVDAVVAAYSDDEEGQTMKKEIAQQEGALGYVDGVAIAEKAPAYVTSPAPAMNGRKVQLTDATELLLADGKVVYRCEKLGSWKGEIPDDQPCHKTFETPESARIHITFHSRTPDDRKAAREARRPRRVTLKQATPKQAKASELVEKPASSSSHEVGIVARMSQLVDQFERFQSELEVLSKGAEHLSSELKEVVRELPDSIADETTVQNAKKYEQLRDFLR